MTDRNFGQGGSFFIAEVHNLDDKDKAGRVQLKIHGKYDDPAGIPESDYPWGIPLQNIKSAAHNQIGSAPVGVIKGSTVFGMFLDADHQYPIMLGTIAKSGDPVAGTTVNGQVQVDPKTNSTPPGARVANNAFSTRANKNIKNDDSGSNMPPATTDNDARDIVALAKQVTKLGTAPTIASLPGSVQSVLGQLQQVDPNNLSASLPQAVQALTKLKQLMNISSPMGNIQTTGSSVSSGISQAASSTSMEYIIQALVNALNSTNISDTSRQVIYSALMQLETQTSYTPDVQSIVQSQGSQFASDLLNLINSGTLTDLTLEALIQQYISQMNDATTSNSLGSGITQGNILNNVAQLIPVIGNLIQKTNTDHLPNSVLNVSTVQQALQKFAKNQAILKMPESGKKALAELACSPAASMLNGNMVNIVNGLGLNLPTAQINQIKSVVGTLFK